MLKQEIKIELFDDKYIILSTKNQIKNIGKKFDNYYIIEDSDNSNQYNLILTNISEDYSNTVPIACKIHNNQVKHIYLLEETDYILKYVNLTKNEETSLFSTLNNISDIIFDTINNKDYFLNFRGYVGKTFIDVLSESFSIKIPIEIRSKKISYDEEYKQMINDLSEITSNLIYNINPSVYQRAQIEKDNVSNYDYFLLLTYIFADENLPSVFEYLSRNLNSTLETCKEKVPISFASNIGLSELSEIIANPKEIIETNNFHFIEHDKKQYIPLEIIEETHIDTLDNPENRFYKYFLELLESIINTLLKNVEEGYIKDQLMNMNNEVNYFLAQKYFKKISKLEYIPLNSQILQKKEGYRDILKYYIMLELGNKIVWNKINETIEGYQKKLNEIYEIWCCFQLLDIIQDIIETHHKEYQFTNQNILQKVILFRENSFIINLEENIKVDYEEFVINEKELKITLLYNKHFRKKYNDYKSYSIYLRPDYTIQLEYDNKIKYVHFDAKYKNRVIFKENKDKTFKNQDIAKMHTYKDAIPKTLSSYILYPGNIPKYFKKNKCKYEGVGALPLRPGNKNDKMRIKKFLIKSIGLLI